MRWYDLLVPLAGFVAVAAIALLFAGPGPDPRPRGTGRLSWAVGVVLLVTGAWVFITVRTLPPEADLGAVDVPAAAAVGACAILAVVRPARAGALLRLVAPTLVGVLVALSALTWTFQPDEWEVTGFGPLVGGSVLVGAPVALAGALLRWSVEDQSATSGRATTRTGRSPAGVRTRSSAGGSTSRRT
jgi:hypothetical protein